MNSSSKILLPLHNPEAEQNVASSAEALSQRQSDALKANVFISHRKHDTELAERLSQTLEQAGHTVWFDEWEINLGDSIVERINQGLEGMSYLVLCYSSAGMSPWVNREWMSTLHRQLSDQSVKILPILLSGNGKPPAILADIRHADLAKDWDKGVQALLKAIR
ncbi:MAG: toll/interleukin-1 receptor domain-containing protein [Thiothrix sp.]|uniref:toll/interleukin-1 receptor domain-containing protein n=1 Tax=Thiothrix sp. TaxID=1032 RepID=UPI00260C5F12|nr:toll/interleukin-1 receptor domain-containing protein [Thiothrix sp.]MDD5392700.1 toll/interleukin-1 receptor domain-containing protein [Thiothrix sp.]